MIDVRQTHLADAKRRLAEAGLPIRKEEVLDDTSVRLTFTKLTYAELGKLMHLLPVESFAKHAVDLHAALPMLPESLQKLITGKKE